MMIRVLGSMKSVTVVDRTPPQNPLPTLATEKAVVQVSTSEASRLTKMVPRFSFHAGVPGRNEPQVFIGQQFDLAKSSELSFRYRLQPGSVSQLLVRRADRVEVIPLSGPSPHGGGGCRVLPHQALRDDGQWHGAHISLASLMGREGKIEHIMVGRVRSPGWRMMRVGGLGSADYLDVDDVRLGPAWPTSAVDVISLDYPDDDVAAIRWSINDEPMATPLTKAIGRPLTLAIGKRGAGRYFLHLSACDRSGNWSTPAHWPLQIDVDPPTASDPLPAPDAAAAEMMVSIRLRDVGTGIDSESIQLRVAGMNVPPDRIRFDGDTGIASVALGELPHRPRVEAGTELTATLVSVADRAGNKLAAPFSWNWTFAPQLLSTGKARMLTTDGGFDATWSVDGERIIFVSDQGGQVDLYQLELASKAISQLTDNQEAESSPQLSPDGQWLAFLKSSRLILLNLQTGQEKSLGEVDGVTWRSEREMLVTRGNRLLTKTLAGDESIVDTLGAGGHILRPRGSSHLCAFTHRVYHQSVWVRSQSRGTTHPLSTNLGDPSLREYDANVSPDKQWIAFASGGRLPGLWLVRPDGTDRTRILPATSPGDRRPSWS
ncbi:MAG: PD40 domain-containing protein, partial [Planctomycetaceae bacterium]|nr:PD40 domain-containing protein [Planctomycetaceae bacterium]